MRTASKILPFIILVGLAPVLFGCLFSKSKTITYTSPPPRTMSLDSALAENRKAIGKFWILPKTFEISFNVPGDTACQVRVEFYNTAHKMLRLIIDSVYSPGQYTHTWKREEDGGETIKAGYYYYHYEICDRSYNRMLRVARVEVGS
jgi:hypothetical protein